MIKLLRHLRNISAVLIASFFLASNPSFADPASGKLTRLELQTILTPKALSKIKGLDAIPLDHEINLKHAFLRFDSESSRAQAIQAIQVLNERILSENGCEGNLAAQSPIQAVPSAFLSNVLTVTAESYTLYLLELLDLPEVQEFIPSEDLTWRGY